MLVKPELTAQQCQKLPQSALQDTIAPDIELINI